MIKSLNIFISLLIFLASGVPAQKWVLKDPGGGGAVPAIAVLNNSDIVYVGSDVGGVRHSNDGAASFEPVNYGIPGTSGRNIAEMEVFDQGQVNLVFSACTGGLIRWDSVKTDHGSIYWKTLFISHLCLCSTFWRDTIRT